MLNSVADFLAGLITFRSPEHYQWFLISLAGLAVNVATTVLQAVLRKRGRNLLDLNLFVFGGCWHGVTALWATVNLIMPHMPERVMSADCVWFNGLMALIYVGLTRWLRPWLFAPRQQRSPTDADDFDRGGTDGPKAKDCTAEKEATP